MAADLPREPGDEPGPLPTPDRALTIGAHPDDAEFGAGATLARWVDQGATITMLVVTDGSKGSWTPGTEPSLLAATRRAEQHAAAGVLGASSVIFLDYIDGELAYSMELRAEVCRNIRLFRPDVVLSHDPWQHYQLHPDHRITGLAAADGLVAARDPLFFPEQALPAHRPQTLLLWSADDPDHNEPASKIHLDRKIDALLCHASQSMTTMGGATPDNRDDFAGQIRAAAAGSRGPTVETFKRLRV